MWVKISGNMSIQSCKLLLVSTSVGPLGTGLGGGVELTVFNLAKAMYNRGHELEIVAPAGSSMDLFTIHQISGNFQVPCQEQQRTAPIEMPSNSVLANMWDYAYKVHRNYDLVVNFCYDWLPLYLTAFFDRPVAHLISMSSLTEAMDGIIEQVVNRFPQTVAIHSQAQANTFSFGNRLRCVLNGLDLSLYEFNDRPNNTLAWVGRIAPEKGLEDAVQAAQITGILLKIFGLMQDQDYWQQICQNYPDAPIEYIGFLPTDRLQKALGQCRAVLMTPRWVEAFGNVVVEALACGTPVITYRRGGPAEIVRDGETGFLVEPDRVDALVKAIADLDKIDRTNCRRQAELEYSLNAFGARLEQWIADIFKEANLRSQSQVKLT